MAKLEYGFLCSREYIHSTSCQTELSSGFKKKRTKTNQCQLTAASHFQCSCVRGPRWLLQSLSALLLSSVEALASVLVPVAVHHQADNDEEDARQHGKEHGEENGYSAHPLITLTH